MDKESQSLQQFLEWLNTIYVIPPNPILVKITKQGDPTYFNLGMTSFIHHFKKNKIK